MTSQTIPKINKKNFKNSKENSKKNKKQKQNQKEGHRNAKMKKTLWGKSQKGALVVHHKIKVPNHVPK